MKLVLELTSSAAVSLDLANRIAWLVNDLANPTNETYGRNTQESFAMFIRDTLSQKMYPASSQATLDGFSDRYSGTWPRWGTMRRGVCTALPTWAHRTDDNDCSCWATPNTMDGMELRSDEALIRQATTQRKGRTKPANLREQVDGRTMALWPTPRAIYGEHPGMTDERHLTGAVQLWPTPQSRDYRSGDEPDSERMQRKQEQGWSANLNDVALWSTPAAQDAKNATLPPSQETRDTLPGDMIRQGVKGQLNPAWVEMLQGVPIGWTDIDAPETEAERLRQPARWPACMGRPQYEDEPPRVAQGVKNRVARLKALGNAIVPAQIAPIFAAIVAHTAEEESQWTTT